MGLVCFGLVWFVLVWFGLVWGCSPGKETYQLEEPGEETGVYWKSPIRIAQGIKEKAVDQTSGKTGT